jgi:hypothetical protein
MMNRCWFWSMMTAGLLALGLFSGCSSDDETDEPPLAEIVHPLPGDHLTERPDSVLVYAADDRGINRVEISLDDELLSTLRQPPYRTRLPLGIYADGLGHVLRARAYDSRGQTGDAAPVSITIDPGLQTVPQIISLGPAPDEPQHLLLTLLAWPEPGRSFSWQAAADDGFTQITHSGDGLTDTTVHITDAAQGIVYARVRAVDGQEISGWSRTKRYSGLQTWRMRYPMAGSQLGASILVRPDDGQLLIVSHGAAGHPVSWAAVQTLSVSPEGDLLSRRDLLPADYRPTSRLLLADGRLAMAGRRRTGASFLALNDQAGGQWIVEPQIIDATALIPVSADPGGGFLAVGADRRVGTTPGGGLFAAVAGDGTLTPTTSFPLAPEHEVSHVWALEGGGFVLAGQVLDGSSTTPGGIWIAGLAAADQDARHEVRWTVRLGTVHRWLLCGAGEDGNGVFVLTGAARHTEPSARYGFLAGIDQDGRVRWQVTDHAWQQFSSVAPDTDGRWVAVGARRRHLGDQRYEFETAIRGLSPYGATLWQSVHRDGQNAQAWALAAHPGAGWYVVGARHDGVAGFDVDLLRIDDRGNLQ